MSAQKILITSALPYANGPIHFGHIAGAYLPADCYARFQRLKKNDVLFICGSDEYGIAIALSSELAGRSPKDHVDIFHALNKLLFEKLEISFDHYSRTTWPGHIETTYQYFNDLLAKGFIEEKETEQLYSIKDDKFLADRYVVGTCPKCGYEDARGDECTRCAASYEATDLKNPRSKLTGSPLTLKKTTHWFLKLDLFKEQLNAWIGSKGWKPNVINFIKSYIQDLRPRAITRDTYWGIPVPLPQGKNKVLYVWFDAPIGYISATKEWAQLRGSQDSWKDYWLNPATKLVQFVGKDNIPFHAVIFPAMTMGQTVPYKLVDELPANEFYNLEGRQFSKSDGWYIDLQDFLQNFSADQIRYTIASNAPETSDSEFTWRDFELKCNTDLVGKFGNFVHRTCVFLQNNLNGTIPERGPVAERDAEFMQTMKNLIAQIEQSYDTFKLRKAAQHIMELAQAGNVYFDVKHPWKDAKGEETRPSMQTTLSLCLECAKLLAIAACPIIPEACQKIWNLLGNTTPLKDCSWNDEVARQLPVGSKLLTPSPIFRKIESEEIEREIQKLQGTFEKIKSMQENKPKDVSSKQMPVQDVKNQVSIEDVRKLDLRVVKIVSAKSIPKSKKLLELEVNDGMAIRTIVSGIGHRFKSEDLVGKNVVIVANLAPATLMGVQSQGMILVGEEGEMMQLLECSDLTPGSSIT
jgi:methionyl-tRNA synthetase